MTPSNKSNAVTVSKQDAPARCWNNLGRGWTWHTETDYLWCCVCVCVFGNVLPVWATAAMGFVLFLEKKKRWGGWDREKNRERGARWQRERLVCFQLIHFLPDVGSHLSWLETEHTAGILMTVRLLCALPSPPSLPTSLSLILTPSIYPLYTYSTFCLLNWFPASCLSLSPSPFFLPLLISALSRCSCTPPTQISLPTPPLLLSISPSDLALPLLLLGLSLTGYIIQLHSSSLMSFFAWRSFQFLLSSRLQHCPAPRLSFLLWLSASSHLASASRPPRLVCLPSPFMFLFRPLRLFRARAN